MSKSKIPKDVLGKVKENRFKQWIDLFPNIWTQLINNPHNEIELAIKIDPLIPPEYAKAKDGLAKDIQKNKKGTRVSNPKKSSK